MIEIIKAAFSAGEVKTFLIQGEYLEILEAAYPVDVAMMDRSGAQLSTMRNAEASYFSRPGRYEVVQVTSPQTQTIRLFVGSGDAGTRRTSGDVSVIDGEKSRTLAGGMFAGAPAAAAGATTFANVQLWNPANSGKNLIVTQMDVSWSSASNALVYFRNTALALVYGENPSNKKAGGAAPGAQLRIELTTTAPVLTYGILKNVYLQPSAITNWAIKGALVVPPGFGLAAFNGQAVGLGLNSNFEWFEETI